MRCIDLFSGCGGLSLGFMQAGFQVVAALDNWVPAVAVYRKNFDHPVHEMDLTKEQEAIEMIRQYDSDLIMGGPPCQDFSSAGKRDTTLGRADLTYHFANIVLAARPQWFVMENVERIKKSHVLRDIVEPFVESGYGLSAVILDASYCGAPQARSRFFLIGHLGDRHNQLNQNFYEALADTPMTVRDYLGNTLDIDYYYRHPRNYSRRGVYSVDEPSPTVRGVNRPVPAGYRLHSCDPKGVDLSAIRPLTTTERSYIQTFPPSFEFFGTKTNMEQMIGNAVPVKLAEFVGRVILDYLKTGSRKERGLFDDQNEGEPFVIPDRALRPRSSSARSGRLSK